MQNFDPTNLDHLIQSVHKANRPEVWKVRTLLQGAAAYTQQARSLIIGEVHPEVPRLGYGNCLCTERLRSTARRQPLSSTRRPS